MLTALRNSAQSWYVKVLLGIIAVSFVLAFGVVGGLSNTKEVLVEVDGTEILVNDFLRLYQRELERLQERFPENAEVIAGQIGLRGQVYERMLNRHLMLREAEAQGLRVTDAEVRQAVTEQPGFQVGERFDYETYRQILAQNRLTPAEFEASLRDDLLLTKLQRALVAGVIVSDTDVEQRYRVENEQVAVDYVFVDPARVRLPKPPTAKELQAHYEAHPERFAQPAQFKLRYFTLSLEDLEGQVEVRDRAIERYYERNRETEFTTPRQVRASHILKRLPQDADADAVAAAREALAPVLEQAKEGADFAQLAKAHSEDFSAEKGGDLGFFKHEDMVPAFADAAFKLAVGEVSGIVRSAFGLHIIRVTEDKPGAQTTLAEARAEIVAKLRTKRAERKLELEAQRMTDRVAQEGLAGVAERFGKAAIETDFIDGSGVVSGLGSTAPLYALLRNKQAGEGGVWTRNPVLGHVFYEVVERKEAFTKPLADVRGEVVRQTREAQRRALAVEEAKAALERLRAGATLEAVAGEYDLPLRSVAFTVVAPEVEGLGTNPGFQRAAFGLTPEAPYALNIHEQKAYLLRLERRFFDESEPVEDKKAQIASQLEDALRQYVVNTEIARMRGAAQIELLAPEYLGGDLNARPTRDRAM